jgi:hypothetical protein
MNKLSLIKYLSWLLLAVILVGCDDSIIQNEEDSVYNVCLKEKQMGANNVCIANDEWKIWTRHIDDDLCEKCSDKCLTMPGSCPKIIAACNKITACQEVPLYKTQQECLIDHLYNPCHQEVKNKLLEKERTEQFQNCWLNRKTHCQVDNGCIVGNNSDRCDICEVRCEKYARGSCLPILYGNEPSSFSSSDIPGCSI